MHSHIIRISMNVRRTQGGCHILQKENPGRDHARTSLPPLLAIRNFSGEGCGGLYVEAPLQQEFYIPFFYTPLTGLTPTSMWLCRKCRSVPDCVAMLFLSHCLQGSSGTNKNSPKRKLLGQISVICADVRVKNFGQALETQEKRAFGRRHP